MYIFKNMDTLSDDDVEFDSKPMEKDMQDKKTHSSSCSTWQYPVFVQIPFVERTCVSHACCSFKLCFLNIKFKFHPPTTWGFLCYTKLQGHRTVIAWQVP